MECRIYGTLLKGIGYLDDYAYKFVWTASQNVSYMYKVSTYRKFSIFSIRRNSNIHTQEDVRKKHTIVR